MHNHYIPKKGVSILKLLTKELRKKLPPIDATEGVPDPMVICKFFYPDFHWTWYALEYDGSDCFWGIVDGDYVEMGYFNLSELSANRGKLGLPIERDLYFTPCPKSALINTLKAKRGTACLV